MKWLAQQTPKNVVALLGLLTIGLTLLLFAPLIDVSPQWQYEDWAKEDTEFAELQANWVLRQSQWANTTFQNVKTIAQLTAQLTALRASLRPNVSTVDTTLGVQETRPLGYLTNHSSGSSVSTMVASSAPPVGETQYLFFRPRYGAGLNNQLEEFWFALQLALNLQRGLVLPMIAEGVTWFHPNLDRLIPFEDLFDSTIVSQLVPTITTAHWKVRCHSKVEADIYPAKKNRIMQKQYEANLNISWKTAQKIIVRSWRQLRSMPLPDCLGVQWPRELLDGVLDKGRTRPGDPPLGGLVERNSHFRNLRKHTVATKAIQKRVAPFIQEMGQYLAVHVRVGDFCKWCGAAADAVKCPTEEASALKIKGVAQKHALQTVFVACDPEYLQSTLDALQRHNPNVSFRHFHLKEEPYHSHPDILGVAEQLICVGAVAFIGNGWSTWTRSVHEWRYITGCSCTTDYLWGTSKPWCVAT